MLLARTPALRDALADRYRIVRELARGDMANVYLAQDVRQLRREVTDSRRRET